MAPVESVEALSMPRPRIFGCRALESAALNSEGILWAAFSLKASFLDI